MKIETIYGSRIKHLKDLRKSNGPIPSHTPETANLQAVAFLRTEERYITANNALARIAKADASQATHVINTINTLRTTRGLRPGPAMDAVQAAAIYLFNNTPKITEKK